MPPSSAAARCDERGAALLVGDVERERDVGVDPLDAACAADDAHAGLAELAHGRGADAARRARDDRGLALELHAGAGGAVRRLTEIVERRLDDDRLERPVAAVALDERDRVGDVLPRGDAAEDGVLAVEPRRSLGR